MTKNATISTRPAAFAAEIVHEIATIRDEWTALCDEGMAAEAFARPEWFEAFARNFAGDMFLVVVRRGDSLRAVLPLTLRADKLHGLPVRKLAAAFNLQSQRFDLVHGSDEAEKAPVVEALWNAIRDLDWNVFETRLTPEDSWLRGLVELAGKEGRPTGTWAMDGAPFVSLPAGEDKEKLVEDYFKSLSKNRRKLLGKNLRHLEEAGRVEFVTTRGYDASLLETYFALEAQSWKARAGTDVNSDAAIARLHDDFAQACDDVLFTHELKLDGRTIAMYLALGFDEAHTIGWKMSFDEEYSRFSPGNVLFREVLAECMRRGSGELDMLSPQTYNKMLFASGVRRHDALYVFGRGMSGRLLHAWKFRVAAKIRDIRARGRKESE